MNVADEKYIREHQKEYLEQLLHALETSYVRYQKIKTLCERVKSLTLKKELSQDEIASIHWAAIEANRLIG